MNQAIGIDATQNIPNRETEWKRPKPPFDTPKPAPVLLEPRRTNESIHQTKAGIYIAETILVDDDLWNTHTKIETNQPPEIHLRAWLAQLLQLEQLPYLGPTTMGAIYFRVGNIDKSCAIEFKAPNIKQELSALWNGVQAKGDPILSKSKIPGAPWQTDDVVLALRIPTEGSNGTNKDSVMQIAVWKRLQGENITNQMNGARHKQRITELLNLMLGHDSFGGEGAKKPMKDTSMIKLPSALSGQKLADINEVRILPNDAYGGTIRQKSKPLYLVHLANYD